jgi:hypothetical protein
MLAFPLHLPVSKKHVGTPYRAFLPMHSAGVLACIEPLLPLLTKKII